MPLNYSAFISYTTGWTKEYEDLIDAIQRRLEQALQFYVRDPLWRYDKDEAPGAQTHATLREVMCQSACMVVLYVPSYEFSDTCVWEFVAMEHIEGTRLEVLTPPLNPAYRMVIPIILKKRKEDLPKWISSRNYVDLTKYVTPDKTLIKALDDERCSAEMEKIAEAIGEVTRRMLILQADPCVDCPQGLPAHDDARVKERWIGNPPKPKLPSRTAV